MSSNSVFFDFSKNADIRHWIVVNDAVMGGKSNGNFYINKEGNAVFSGKISLENNGGFSSVRCNFMAKNVEKYSKIVLYVKGDGKKYQCRIKTKASDYYSYIATFQTTQKWESIEIKLSEMYPAFRGRKLRMQNFPSLQMEEIAFLIGNKKEENFQLEIDKIVFE